MHMLWRIWMRPIKEILKRNRKLHTQERDGGKTVVIIGYSWVCCETLKLSSDLKGDKGQFLDSFRTKEIYYEDVNFSFNGGEYELIRCHGPYRIEEVSKKDYKEIVLTEALELVAETLLNPDFSCDETFVTSFGKEVEELLISKLSDKNEIFWLSKVYNSQSEWNWRYDF